MKPSDLLVEIPVCQVVMSVGRTFPLIRWYRQEEVVLVCDYIGFKT